MLQPIAMRRLSLLATASAAVCTLVACNESEPDPLYAQVDYQIRCIDCEPRTNDERDRRIATLDASEGFDLTCDVSGGSDRRIMSFTIANVDPEDSSKKHSLILRQVNLDSDDPGEGCLVTVTESGNTYEGRCTGDEPTASKPCKISLRTEGKVIRGTLYCDNIPNLANKTATRYLTAPGSTKGTEVELHGCPL